MMATKTIVKNWVGSWWGVFFASISALACGAAIGGAELMLKKVEVVDSFPHGKRAFHRFFVLGNDFSGENWQEKLSAMATGRPNQLTFYEGDLNLFLKNSTAQNPPSGVVAQPNAKLFKSRLQLGMVLYFNFRKDPLCVQVLGGFEKGEEGFYYSARRAYVGALPIPQFIIRPLMASLLRRSFSDPSTEPLVKSWKMLKDVTIENGALRLTWK